jgi:hypothetical protein
VATVTSIELGRRIPSIHRKRLVLQCPYCGQIHRKTRLRLLATALFFIAAWIGLFAPKAQASSEARVGTSNQSIYITGKQREDIHNLSASPTATVNPTPSPEFVLRTPPSPTPLPIPKTGIIWSPVSNGVYLYEEPGLDILREIPNGTIIHLFDEFTAYGNLPWTRIGFEEQAGWIDATKVSRLHFEGETFYLVNDAGGTYLYSAPKGRLIVWLSFGTPLRYQNTKDEWAAVSTLNGEKGWVVLDKLIAPNEVTPCFGNCDQSK